MQALKLAELSGPDGLQLVDQPDPEPTHFMTPGEGVVIDVRAAAVSFPDVLQTRGLYQFKPPLPFVPGAEVAGMTMVGGMAERVVAPPSMTFALPDALDFAEGAGLILNYHTAYFALKLRGRLDEGEHVLVHG